MIYLAKEQTASQDKTLTRRNKYMTKETQSQYIKILEGELIPALGCTEPIAIAYAAAKAREILGVFPEKIVVRCSGNIIKNVKGVVVPTTTDMRGICVSAILGAVGGDANRELEVLSTITPADVEKTRELLAQGMCKEELLADSHCLHIIVSMTHGENSSLVEIRHGHKNIIRMERNGEIIQQASCGGCAAPIEKSNDNNLSIAKIVEFANTVDTALVAGLFDQQIAYNSAIAEEGLRGTYGANIGQTLLQEFGNNISVRAKALAAAGSDARMSGCELPVVINSGSGNQGMTVSLPVAEYAKELGATKEQMYRALCISNLVAIHFKSQIGKLSAFCGAVSAATGAAAGIAYLKGADLEMISVAIVNTLANVSGIVCDGAKPSCAIKIASSLDAAILGVTMAIQGRTFHPGEGLVKDNIEETLTNFAKLAKDGMRETDAVILKLMTSDK